MIQKEDWEYFEEEVRQKSLKEELEVSEEKAIMKEDWKDLECFEEEVRQKSLKEELEASEEKLILKEDVKNFEEGILKEELLKEVRKDLGEE